MAVRDTDLDGKVAVVTGASKGIGRALAVGLSGHGALVAANYKTDAAGARETCDAIKRSGGTAIPFQADIGSPSEANRLISEVWRTFGRIDVLVNNAGRTRFGPAANVTPEDWDDVFHTNVRGVFFTSLAAAARMPRYGGAIVNISSCAATLGIDYHAVYSPSKAALEALTRQLALELAPRVRVNAIAPGPTSMARNWEYDPGFDGSWADVTPMRRIAQPEDFVEPLVFLATARSAFLIGEVLHIDGGWTLRGHAPAMATYDFTADRERG